MPKKSEHDFKIGDLVRLNSGGPAMSVLDFIGEQVFVGWIRENGSLQEARFPPQCLQPAIIDSEPEEIVEIYKAVAWNHIHDEGGSLVFTRSFLERVPFRQQRLTVEKDDRRVTVRASVAEERG